MRTRFGAGAAAVSAVNADGTRADLGAFPHPFAPVPLTVAWHEGATLRAQDPSLSLAFGTAAAVALTRERTGWLKAADALFMSPLVLPALAFGFAALIFINKLGLRPTIPTLVLGHVVVCVPFVLRTTVASLAQLDPALLDASYSLGASWWRTFRRITLPLASKGIAAGAFLAFMASFDNVPVSLFLADERTEVLPIHLWQQIESNLDVRTAAASALIARRRLAKRAKND